MKKILSERRSMGAAVTAMVFWFLTAGAAPNTGGGVDKTNGLAESTSKESRLEKPESDRLSPVVNAVVQMVQAEVSSGVIKAYVESEPPAEPLSEKDIIALKQHEVPDEIVTMLIREGAKARKPGVDKEMVARALAARNARYGGMDPESYEYFRHYYLHPRALGSAYQRTAFYYGPRWRPWYRGGRGHR